MCLFVEVSFFSYITRTLMYTYHTMCRKSDNHVSHIRGQNKMIREYHISGELVTLYNGLAFLKFYYIMNFYGLHF